MMDEPIDDTGVVIRALVVADTGLGKAAMVPYISTDRADLLRIVEHANRIRATLNSIPAANAKVTAAQWTALTHELHAFVTLARRIEGRING